MSIFEPLKIFIRKHSNLNTSYIYHQLYLVSVMRAGSSVPYSWIASFTHYKTVEKRIFILFEDTKRVNQNL